jgi:F-type H+-transporting ATPase subunit delta
MHQDSKVASRYAKALLDLAVEQNKLEEVKEDMLLIARTSRENKGLVHMLKSPVIKTDKKIAILNTIFAGKIGTMTRHFIEIIARKKRENILSDIAHSFAELHREYHGILLAEITTAVPLDAEGRAKATRFIEKLSKKVELKEKVDPDLIGGFIIRVGDRQYDASIESRINDLKRSFSKNPYISEI